MAPEQMDRLMVTEADAREARIAKMLAEKLRYVDRLIAAGQRDMTARHVRGWLRQIAAEA